MLFTFSFLAPTIQVEPRRGSVEDAWSPLAEQRSFGSQLGSASPYLDIDTRSTLESGGGYHYRLIARCHGGHLHIKLVQARPDQPSPLHMRRRAADGHVHRRG